MHNFSVKHIIKYRDILTRYGIFPIYFLSLHFFRKIVYKLTRIAPRIVGYKLFHTLNMISKFLSSRFLIRILMQSSDRTGNASPHTGCLQSRYILRYYGVKNIS